MPAMILGIATAPILGAFLFGLVGSYHCLAMCGGVAGMASLVNPNKDGQWAWITSWQMGRLLSYTLMGGLAGGFGFALTRMPVLEFTQVLFALAASLAIMMTGGQMLGFKSPLQKLEQMGALTMLRVVPWVKRWLPPKTPGRAFWMGAAWGLVPCGFLYTMILASAAMQSITMGALIMLAFALGTAPSLLLVVSGLGLGLARERGVRYFVGTLVMVTGLISLINVVHGPHSLAWLCQ